MIPEPHYSIYRDSDNIVARICLPQMRWEGRDESERKLFEQRYRKQVEQAEETALRRWSLRILEAESADEVFAEG